MQKRIRKFQRNIKKRVSNLFDVLALTTKIGLALVVLFFLFIFIIAKPLNLLQVSQTTEINEENVANLNHEEFIELVTPYAQEAAASYDVRPSLLVAQAALESNWGNSSLSRDDHNYFGIKSKKGNKYATKEHDEDWQEIDATFKEYDSLESSVLDYASLLQNGTSWDGDFYQEVTEAENYKEAAYAIQKAGYATDPDYAEKLIHIIEQYQLYELDN